MTGPGPQTSDLQIRSLLISYSGRLDVHKWARRHAAGEVPDRWPYGLDRLAEHGFTVATAPSFHAGAIGGRVARAARAVGHYEWWETAQKAHRAAPADLCVCWDERAGVPSALRRGVPVATGVIAMTDRSRAHRALFGPALRRAHRVWSLSSAQLPIIRDHLGVPKSRLRHLLFGIDADFFSPDDTDPTPGLVVTAGNDRHRDYPTAVRAMAMVHRQVGGSRLEIATHHAIDVPAHLGVRHRLLSHPDLRTLYRRSQIVIVALQPNLHVSGVTVALEAMACGRPVIITATPGMADYVAPGETGLLVPVGDPEALATAILRLVRDPDEAAALGAGGHKAVQERFTTTAQARTLAQILRD